MDQPYLLTKFLSPVSFVCGIACFLLPPDWFFFFQPFKTVSLALVITAILLPWFGLAVLFKWRGRVFLDPPSDPNRPGQYDEAQPRVGACFLLPPFCLAMRAAIDIRLDIPALLIPPAIVLAAGIVFGISAGDKNFFRERKWLIGVVSGFYLIYGAATTLLLNALLDWHAPRIYAAEVLDREEFSGRRHYYKIELSAFGPFSRGQRPEVGEAQYWRLRPGSHICVTVHDGAFGSSWYWNRQLVASRSTNKCIDG